MTYHYPDLDTFARLARDVELVPVYRRLTSDTLTPPNFGRVRARTRGGTAQADTPPPPPPGTTTSPTSPACAYSARALRKVVGVALGGGGGCGSK